MIHVFSGNTCGIETDVEKNLQYLGIYMEAIPSLTLALLISNFVAYLKLIFILVTN